MNPKSYTNLLKPLCCEHTRSETGLVLLQILNDPLDTLRIFWEFLIVRFISFNHFFYRSVNSFNDLAILFLSVTHDMSFHKPDQGY